MIGAAVLLGTGAGIAFFMLVAHRAASRDDRRRRAHRRHRRFPVHRDRRVVQPITGVCSPERGYSLREGWIVLSIVLYLVTGAFWLPVVWMQMRMRDLAARRRARRRAVATQYHRLFWRWFAFGFPAFAAVLAIFWLMIARPRIG